MKSITKLSAILIAALACASLPAMAQDSTPGSTNTAPARPRARAAGFRGKVSAVDTATMTLTLKNRNGDETKVKVTSTTKITKDGDPGVFADAVEGVNVMGSGKKGDDGVWTANTLRITTKPPARRAPSTNAPPSNQ
jgi:uncharacterized protein YdeI (BOF family)